MLWSRWDVIKGSDIPWSEAKKITIPLPSEMFWGYVPILATYTEEYLNDWGVLAVEDRDAEDEDEKMVAPNGEQLTFVKWNISDMVNGFINGFRFIFYNRGDLVQVHNLIEGYFDKVNEIIEYGNTEVYEFDDRLEDIDAFNRALFEQNKGQIVESRKELINKVRLGTLFPELIIQQNIMRPMEQVTQHIEAHKYDEIQTSGRWGAKPIQGGSIQPPADNPLAPIFAQEPQLNLKPKYVSRYISPEERKLEAEFENAKKILKNREDKK